MYLLHIVLILCCDELQRLLSNIQLLLKLCDLSHVLFVHLCHALLLSFNGRLKIHYVNML